MNAKPLTAGLTALLLLSGCAASPGYRALPDGNVARLIQCHPAEAERARAAAPSFTRDALKTISGLEEQLALAEKP